MQCENCGEIISRTVEEINEAPEYDPCPKCKSVLGYEIVGVPAEGSSTIDTADAVLHKPTGETWIVACVEGERISWVGWPEGSGQLSDCTLIKKATPEARIELLQQMAAMKESDHRQRYAAHRLKAETHNAD